MIQTKEVLKQFKDWPVFTIRDVRMKLGKKNTSKYVKVLLHDLVTKGEVKRIRKGHYTLQEDSIVSGFAFAPFYYGLHFALTHYGLWTQSSNLVIITPNHVRTGVRDIMGTNVVVRRIQPKQFYGYETVQNGNHWIPVSTVEKTIIDFVYFHQKIPEEAKKNMFRAINPKKLHAQLIKSPKWVQLRIKQMIPTKKQATVES